MRLCIWHLYPQDMNIYGDRGNVIALAQRARWRGLEVETRTCDVGERIAVDECDLVFAGGGQDDQQIAVAADLAGPNGAALRELVDDDTPMLLICGTYQLFGHYFRTSGGSELRGAGLLDLHTVAGPRRMIGDALVQAERTLIGFENHSGQTFLGAGSRPLGRVLVGGGNNGRDGTEGARYREVRGSYLHGPLLPKNPWLSDELIGAALRRRGHRDALPPLDDDVELAAHHGMVERIARTGQRKSGAA